MISCAALARSAPNIDHRDPHEESAQFFLHYGHLSDFGSLSQLVQSVRPDEIYNLGAQTRVAVSFENPLYTAGIDALGTLRLLGATRLIDYPV